MVGVAERPGAGPRRQRMGRAGRRLRLLLLVLLVLLLLQSCRWTAGGHWRGRQQTADSKRALVLHE